MRTAYGYIRVSTEEQADSGLGLEAQRQRIRNYCKMKGLGLGEIYEDPGLSGGKPLGSRQAGSQLLAEARRPNRLWSSPGSTVSSGPSPTPPRPSSTLTSAAS